MQRSYARNSSQRATSSTRIDGNFRSWVDFSWIRRTNGYSGDMKTIDMNELVKLPRFEFLAAYLVLLTSKKANREFVKGYQVKHRSGQWVVLQTQVAGGTIVYATDDASKLFDHVRRGPLGYLTREADNLRASCAIL